MTATTYAELLKSTIEQHASLDCLHIKRRRRYQTWTYADLHRDLKCLTSMLRAKGVGRGTNCTVIGPNTPEWMIAYHGIILAGGCTVPIDPNLPAQEIREIVRQTEPRLAFCSPAYLALFRELASSPGAIEEIVLLDDSSSGEEKHLHGFIDEGDEGNDAFAETFDPQDPCAILFTSGTTGKTKGATLVQRNFTTAGIHGVPRMGVTAEDTVLAVLPLHHVFGFAACIAGPLAAGMDIVFIPEIKGPLIIEGLKDKRVSMLPAVPQMLELFYNNIQRNVKAKGAVVSTLFAVLTALSRTIGAVAGTGFRRRLFRTVHEGFGGNLRVLISGGASLKKRCFDGFRLMGFGIVEGYGLTETFGPITLCPLNDARLGSVGPVLEGNEVKLHQQDTHGVGELCFRGTTVFAGYSNNSQATDEVFDSEGWFHTGDLGRISNDGFIYITGRAKELIVLDSGKNVYPDEVEEYYSSSPMIEEIGVFGHRAEGGETVAAVIVPAKDLRAKYSTERLNTMINDELVRLGGGLPTYKKIASFVVVMHPLPRTTTRKLKKPEIRKLYDSVKRQTGAAELPQAKLSFLETASMETPEYVTVVDYIVALSPGLDREKITPRSHLELDLGLDSLKSLDLVAQLEEHFGISVPPEALLKLETLGDAVSLVHELQTQDTKGDSRKGGTIKERIGSDASDTAELPQSRSLLYRMLPPAALALSKLLWGTRVEGHGDLVNNRPTIYAANHEGMLDTVWLIGALPWNVRRRTFGTGKAELLTMPVLAGILKRSNMIPVEREGDVVEALRTSIGVLKDGKNLLIFPEGTRTRTGEMGRFKSGLGTLMLQTDAQVIPVRVKGSYQLWPAGSGPRLFDGHKHQPSIQFGEPITHADLVKRGIIDRGASAEDVAAAMRKIIAGM